MQVFAVLLVVLQLWSSTSGHVLQSAMVFEEDSERWMHPEHKSSKKNARDFEDAEYWINDAQARLKANLVKVQAVGEAKNVIFYLGDGMSVPTVTAARILKGQTVDNVQFGEEAELHMDTFPFTGYSKTFCSDSQVADSACSATAYLCGSKGNDATIGVTPTVTRKSCDEQAKPENHVHSVLKWAQDAGKSTGIITTTRVTHASPAGTFAHIADRDWENDQRIERDVPGASEKCDDIAEQLVLREPGSKINVIMGGGRNQFTTTTDPDPEYPNLNGYRGDGRNLTEEWAKDKDPLKSSYITKKSELLAINTSSTDFLLGLFEPDHMLYVDEMEGKDDPTLEEMVKVGIEILSRNPNGFFLFVEGGKIDHGHHANQVKRALVEAIEFDKAIKLGDEMTSDDDTLIVVTADHAHVMHIAGYPQRGNPILEYVRQDNEPHLALDGLPYATLGYGNGPGWNGSYGSGGWIDNETETRRNILNDNFNNPNYVVPVPVPMSQFGETHGGDDVPIFAKGPYAHLLTGTHQQSYIPHVVQYAACMGPRSTHCDDNPLRGGSDIISAYISTSVFLLCISLFPM